ncbi:MAG: hypothetical protein WCB27_16400 [Thermoguttaceae bacterium]
MHELAIGLIVLVIALGVITLVGHGIWVLLSLIFSAGKRPAGNVAVCVFCGHRTPVADPYCEWCGKEMHNSTADELRDLAAVERQLQRWRQSGRLTSKEFEGLLDRVHRYREGLLHPAARQEEQPASAPPVARAPTPTTPTRAEEPILATLVAAPRVEAVKPAPAKPQAAAKLPAAAKPRAATPTPPRPQPIQPPKPVPPPEPPPPRRSWSEMLAGFMEERNIRWGELIGGLLIVGPAIALVISFWEQLAANPYLQLSTFVATCSAVFGVGLYAHHRWKLRSTSLGLLMIATLLVPLCFLGMAAVCKENWRPGTIAADLLTLAVFTGLTWCAARVLVPQGPWLQVIAVLGGSASILVAARWLSPESPDWWHISAACLPVAFFAASVGTYLAKLPPRKRLTAADAGSLFTLLGTAAFAMLIALGMTVVRSDGIAAALSRMSLPAALAAVPILACGLTVRRGVARDAELAGWHLCATTVALLGMIGMLAALGLAWPHPLAIVAVAAIDCAVLVLAAFRWRLPALHAGAIACATLGYLTAFHLIYSGLPLFTSDAATMYRKLISGPSGTALVGLFLIFAVASEAIVRLGRRRHALVYAGGAGVMALLGLTLTTVHGLQGGGDAVRAAVLCTIYGAGGLAVAARWRRIEVVYLGLTLLAAAPLWALWADPQRHAIQPLWGAVLAAEALVMVGIAAFLRSGDRSNWLSALYRIPLQDAAQAAASIALLLSGWAAWQDRQAIAIEHSPALLIATVCIAATYLLLAWQRRLPAATWLASMVVMLGLVHAAVWNYPSVVGQSWLAAMLAMLTHSTMAAIASLLLARSLPQPLTASQESLADAESIRYVLCAPLADSAVLSSLLTLAVLPFVSWSSPTPLAGCLYWLAAIWLAIGWRRRNAVLFAAHQLMLTLATGVATAAWLKNQSWCPNWPGDLLHPYSLQAFGVTLGVLSLLWIAARIVLRGNATAEELLNPIGPTVDWCVRHGLIVAQLAVALIPLLPSMAEELTGAIRVPATFRTTQLMIYGGGAWLLLGVLAAMLLVAIWQRWRNAELVGSLLLAATVPCLIAGCFTGDVAAAAALRWGLACCFLVVSAAIWSRARLSAVCAKARTNVDLNRNSTLLAHGVSLATTALPILALTVVAALCQFAGAKPGGPAANTFFHRLGPSLSYLVPLAVVIFCMVGHAVRESSSGYAFFAGLVAELAVTLGYSLSVVLAHRSFGTAESVTLLQLATITAVAWMLAWLAARRWINVWREAEKGDISHLCEAPGTDRRSVGPFRQMGTVPFLRPATALMLVQLCMSVAGNAVLIGLALFVLAILPPGEHDWTVAAGTPLGWVALVGTVAAAVCRLAQNGRRLSPNIVGLLGMTALGLLACTVRWLLPSPALGLGAESAVWGYRTLMLGWAIYALFIVLATWWVAGLRTLPDEKGDSPRLPERPVQPLVRAAAVWVRVAGILAVLLGLKAALVVAVSGRDYQELLWAAASIAIASGAGATMAVWRRREGWAFSAALGTNLAASLVVCYFHRNAVVFADWWLQLLEANVIASSAVALAWLAARRRLYQLRELPEKGDSPHLCETPSGPFRQMGTVPFFRPLTLGESPLLGTQILLPLVGTIVVLALPVVSLAQRPTHLPVWLADLAAAPGWLALLLSAAAVAWYLGQVSRAKLLHVVAGLAAGIGVLIACHIGHNQSAPAAWLAYHTLTTAWAAAAFAVLAIGRIGLRTTGNKADKTETTSAVAIVQGWVTAIGVAAFAFAVMHAAADRAGAWWSIGAILSLSVTAGLLVLWLRLRAYVFVSGLLLNAAGVVAWLAWEPRTFATLLQTNVLCFAAGSVVWSLLEAAHRQGVPHWQADRRPLCFAVWAAIAAVALLAAYSAVTTASNLFGVPDLPVDITRMDWIALAASAFAVAVCLWNRNARFVLVGQYVLGLSAIAMALCAQCPEPRLWWWWAATALPAFATAAAALGWLLPRAKPLVRLLRIPDSPERWPLEWFPAFQLLLAAIAAALGTWISLDNAFEAMGDQALSAAFAGRLAGNLGTFLLLAATILMAAQTSARRPEKGDSPHLPERPDGYFVQMGAVPFFRAWRSLWQYVAFAAAVLLLGSLGWARLDLTAGTPTGDAPWLHCCVILMAAAVLVLLAGTLGLGSILPNESDWIAAGRRAATVLGSLSIITLAAVLVQERSFFDPADDAWRAPWAASWEIAVVAAAIIALVVACLICALIPRWDPLRLSDRGRTAYVYAAEALLALAGLHLRVTMPGLFALGIIRTYWMLIVMAIAFVGAGLSMLFQRRQMAILSEPLERTALFLPILPPIGSLFIKSYANAGLWFLGNSGPAFWLMMGVFYGVMAVRKRSIVLAALAILTGNMGLWVQWSHWGWGFVDHPQLWLIPIALAALVAEHLDRRRLSDAQRLAVRYLALSVIYVSSTTEFWQHIGQSALLPLVTIVLAVLGVLVGILLRERSFLYLGFTFLVVVIGRMIVYAAFEQKHIWIFWASCIVLGMAIIALFALFEKRRNDVLASVERFKQWKQ